MAHPPYSHSPLNLDHARRSQLKYTNGAKEVLVEPGASAPEQFEVVVIPFC